MKRRHNGAAAAVWWSNTSAESSISSVKDVYREEATRNTSAHRLFTLVFDCLSAGKHKNYWTDLHDTWMEDGSRPRIDPVNFWCWSRSFLLTVLNIARCLFLHFPQFRSWYLWLSTTWSIQALFSLILDEVWLNIKGLLGLGIVHHYLLFVFGLDCQPTISVDSWSFSLLVHCYSAIKPHLCWQDEYYFSTHWTSKHDKRRHL